jgi:hypothetical protein
VVRALLCDPLEHGVDLLDRGWVARLRREAVVREHQRCLGAGHELADKPVMGVGVAEHPSSAMRVEDDRENAVGVLGAHDADRDLTRGAAEDGPVLDLDVGLVDLS